MEASMFLTLLLACPPGSAQDDPPVVVVAQEIQDVHVQVEAQDDKLDGIAHYLADREAVKTGRAPKDWVQPELEKYLEPGAPTSFLPGATDLAATAAENAAPPVKP
jgi:hypothetical protein